MKFPELDLDPLPDWPPKPKVNATVRDPGAWERVEAIAINDLYREYVERMKTRPASSVLNISTATITSADVINPLNALRGVKSDDLYHGSGARWIGVDSPVAVDPKDSL